MLLVVLNLPLIIDTFPAIYDETESNVKNIVIDNNVFSTSEINSIVFNYLSTSRNMTTESTRVMKKFNEVALNQDNNSK